MNKELRKALKRAKKEDSYRSRTVTILKDGYLFSGSEKLNSGAIETYYRYYRQVELILLGAYPKRTFGSIELPMPLLEIGEVTRVVLQEHGSASVTAEQHGIDTSVAEIYFDTGYRMSITTSVSYNGETVNTILYCLSEAETGPLHMITPFNGAAFDMNERPR